ncbi:LOG family protein [Salipaludibacillus agaradhaerens]|uniref:LOG family protein n=1 Tax=Salipaludibacillus agaradhaerens TaxID=76935 RepID=UPI0023EED1A3|nr:TIGR00730 family Rossman fold protein [Salipaludibacillus agaradhaerens]
MTIKRIAIFCGSSKGGHPIYLEMAAALGRRLAEEKITLVYGGARVGCMGAVADACLEAGGDVIGVIPEKLKNVEIAHDGLTDLYVVKTMHERKAKMADLSDAFVALPGGAGTLEEWFEAFTWSQLGYHEKPCCLLNTHDFFNPLVTMLDHTIEEGFMNPAYRETILVENDVDSLINALQNYVYEPVVKWS